eukprot:c25816_g1_i1.p1 GENE.c25816_g1_i1~~c25816_g1_i1.p1  ORF type:complete len:267 (+),score=56.37 c25816_g1_i1:41-841(+)
MVVAVVTGANKGIGFEIARQLIERGVHVFVGGRNLNLVEDATARLQQEAGPSCEALLIDINDPSTINSAAETVLRTQGGLDILVNNAAIAFKSSDPTPFAQQARPTIATNYFGTTAVTDAFLPHMRPGAKIVNVASQLGNLNSLQSDQLRSQFRSDDLTRTELDGLMEQFVTAVEQGTHSAEGWPNSCYAMSKIGVIALTRVQARAYAERSISAFAVCPGYCKTDMTNNSGMRSSSVGAATPAWLGLEGDPELSGKFFFDKRVLQW